MEKGSVVRAVGVRTLTGSLTQGKTYTVKEFIPTTGGACPSRPAVIVQDDNGRDGYFHAHRFEVMNDV